jgi:tetratricopeptide (TPR) repeat protein
VSHAPSSAARKLAPLCTVWFVLPLCVQSCAAQVSAFEEHTNLARSTTSTKSVNEQLNDLFSARRNLDAQPNSSDANVQLGRALQALGEADAASAAFDRALALNPNNAAALFEKGCAVAEKDRWSDSAELFRRAVRMQPAYVEARLGLVEMLLRSGDFIQAKDELKVVLALNPNSAGGYQGLGLVELQEGDFPAAARDFEHVLKLRPGHIDAERGLARTFLHQHKWDEAAALLTTLVTTNSDSSEDFALLGTALANLGDASDAKLQFKKARELSNQQLVTLRAKGENNTGIGLRKEGNMPEAANAFRRAISEKADYCEAHDNLGGILWLQKDRVGALKEFQLAVSCDPKLASARNNLGIAFLYHVHDVQAAMTQFRAAVLLRPAFALAHFNLGKCFVTERNFSAAGSEFRQAILVDPLMAAAHVNLGVVLAMKNGGISPESQTEMQIGLRLDPKLRDIIPSAYLAQLH